MKTLYRLKDEEYPVRGDDHTRLIARAILMNEDGLFAVHHVERDDEFGKCSYFETPGGGVENGESIEQGLLRECFEETGFNVEIVKEIGIVEDDYNYISRHNINCYYLAKIVSGDGKTTIASDGDKLIKETLYLSLSEIVTLYENMDDRLVSGLVKRRELPIWKMIAEKLG